MVIRTSMAAAAASLALTATAAGQGVTPVVLSFDAPVPGTVADRDGEGTGFTGVQANNDGDQYLPANLDLAGGALAVTTTGNDARSNLQNNALEVAADGDAPYSVTTTIRGPVALTQAFQRGGVFVGPDQDNYVKIVLGVGRARGQAMPHIELARESGGVFGSNFQPVQDPATITSIDLTLKVNPAVRQVTGTFAVNGGPEVTAGTLQLKRLPTVGNKAGIITTSDEAPSTTILFERFAVEPLGQPLRAFRCAGRVATIVGSPRGEFIRGTPGADVIVSLGGRDIVNSMGGNDRVCLGAGNDRAIGGPGNDALFGSSGRDRLRGAGGRDILVGGTGKDRLDGGGGRDVLDGGKGRDILFGRAGRDLLRGRGGRDTLLGGRGRDRADGGPGRDRCRQAVWRIRCEI